MSDKKIIDRMTVDQESWDAVQGDDKYRGRLRDKALKNLAKVEWHLHPWKQGTWISVQGKIYQGNGGGEGEENFWAQRGPWLLADARDVNYLTTHDRRSAEESLDKLNALKNDIASLIAKHSIEIDLDEFGDAE